MSHLNERLWKDDMLTLREAEVAWQFQTKKHLLADSTIFNINQLFTSIHELLNQPPSSDVRTECWKKMIQLHYLLHCVDIQLNYM
jgi:hypothetical protein